MLNSSYENFIEAYKKAKPAVQKIVGGEDIPKFTTELVKNHPSLKKHKNEISNLLADVFLSLISIDNVIDSLKKEAGGGGDHIESDVKLFVEKIKNKIDHESKFKDELVEDLSKKNLQENLPVDFKPIKTFGEDIKNIHGYGFMSKKDGDDEEVVRSVSQDEIFADKKQSGGQNPSTPK